MELAAADLDVQAYCRSLALQQIQMLTRLAEIGMQLAEAEGARALAAQARAAGPKADESSVGMARAEAQEAGLAFSRFSRSVQRSLSLRARAADGLCARDRAAAPDREAARKARRDRHREEVQEVLHGMIWDEVEDDGRVDALHAELKDRVCDLYEDEAVRVEGERVFPRLDPARIDGIRAGLAVRLQEADVIEWLDTETTDTITQRLWRSLGIEPYLSPDPPDKPDTG
jgi:hypothetical protein